MIECVLMITDRLTVLLQLPGFLELLVEYYRRSLIQIFGILEEYEVGTEGQRTLLGPLLHPVKEEKEVLKELPAAASESNSQSAEEQRIRRPAEEMEATSPLLPAAPAIDSEEEVKDRKPVIKEKVEHQEQAEPRPQQASKYDKLPIRVEEEEEEWEEVEKRWAELSQPHGFISGLLHWKAGGGDSTCHIQTGEATPTKPTVEREEENNLPAGEETPPEIQAGKDLEGGSRTLILLCCSTAAPPPSF